MADVKYSDAKMYIAEPDDSYTLLNSIQNLDISYADNCGEFPSFSFTDELSFEGTCRLSKEATMALFGIRDAIINCCPDKRVVHLALRAKKARTRKKNFNRAIRILEA